MGEDGNGQVGRGQTPWALWGVRSLLSTWSSGEPLEGLEQAGAHQTHPFGGLAGTGWEERSVKIGEEGRPLELRCGAKDIGLDLEIGAIGAPQSHQLSASWVLEVPSPLCPTEYRG